ncbi:MAG: aminotransferase class I/II-fold pyridoxal phosphate-dependent enzyme [Acidobacteria bacterium]|nr:MAG: aminotransferase class I/II-fold pyridoxal phosphate-dependent enzyme [Acidobacteriota bacterium]
MQRSPDVNLNLNVRGMAPSATVAINERLDEMRRAGREVFKLGLGQSPFPIPEPVVEALRRHASAKDYLPVKGLPELREAVAENLAQRQGVVRSAEQVLVGPGSKELMFLLQLVYYGDLVLPTPCWVSYAPQAQIIGRRNCFIPCRREDRWNLTPEQLDRLCREDRGRPRIVVLNYPNNPTGVTYKLDELKQLAKVAREHRVVLLSDEIYGELHHKGQHVSIARFYPEGTIVSNGLSKWCGAGGWRLGAFVFPPGLGWLRDAMAAVASETFTSTSAPIQYAAVVGFRGGPWLDDYLLGARRTLRGLGRWAREVLVAAGVHCERPDGAFYLFLDCSPLRDRLEAKGIRTDRELCEHLLEETGVGILPGSDFGRGPEELTARIAYVDFDGGPPIEEARKLPKGSTPGEDFLRRHCGRTVTAIERVAEWLAG